MADSNVLSASALPPVAGDTSEVKAAPDKTSLLGEAARRGILPPDKKALYDEAQKRGLLGAQDNIPSGFDPVEGNTEAITKTDPVTGIKTIFSKAGEIAKQEKEKVDLELRLARGHEADVDYDAGTDFNDKIALSMADNDKERRLYLSNRYGAPNVFQDKAGTFYINSNGKKVAPSGSSIMGDMMSDVAASAPELALMARGAAVGSEAGIPGAIIGAMVGAVGGKAIEEQEKKGFGFQSKTPSETGKTYTEAGVGGAVGEVLSRPVTATAEKLLTGGIPRWFSGATPETERLTAQTLGIGGVPPIRSALPEAKITQFHQALGEKLTGDLKEKRNLKAVEGEMQNILRSGGMADKDIPQAMKTIMTTSEAPSYAAFGTMAKEYTQQYEESLVKAGKETTEALNKSLDARVASIRAQTKAIRAGDPLAAQQVAEAIAQGRKDFSRAMQKGYSQIDHLVGDKPIVPTQLPVKRAKALLEKMPESEIKPIVKEIANWQPMETFENMQRMRTRLREMGQPTNLAAAGLTKMDLRDLNRLVDASFDRAALGNAPRAVQLLRVMDGAYREGVRKFQDVGINALIDGVKTGIYPDAQKIVGTIFQRGQSQRAQEIMTLLPEEVRNKVRGEYFSDLIAQATDKTTGQISGRSLNRVVSASGQDKLLDVAFGSKTAADLKLYAQQLAARDEKIPVEALQPNRISDSIKAAQKAQDSLDKFMDNNYLSEMATPSMPPEKVYQHLVQRGNETQLERAINFFGDKSPQVKKLRETALIDLMHAAVEPISSGAGKTIGPDALDKALGGFTKRQQQLLFPGTQAEDLKALAEAAKFLFPKGGSDMMAGLVAGGIKSALPFGSVAGGAALGSHAGEAIAGSALAAYGWGAFWNYVLSRPATIRYLALGLDNDGPAKTVALETMRNMIRAGVMGYLPDINDEAQK